jgi:hypothetical protein
MLPYPPAKNFLSASMASLTFAWSTLTVYFHPPAEIVKSAGTAFSALPIELAAESAAAFALAAALAAAAEAAAGAATTVAAVAVAVVVPAAAVAVA